MAKREAGDDCGGKERAGDGRGRSHTFEGKRSHLATVCNESHRGKTPSVRGDPSLEMLHVHGERAPVGGWPKRAFDIFGAVLALWFFAPFLISIAIAVRLDSAGPSIIRQPRVGFGGRTIRVWDFRCERGTQADLASPSDGEGTPTRLGELLRRTGWDAWPRLVNVLIGEMSFVGPQPYALDDDASFAQADPCYAVRRLARHGFNMAGADHGLR
ncbi:MAG: sugar transferase [Caulobacteraceae bacterium]|nr:sugar transferase [Caulobacteraceae bacterium]